MSKFLEILKEALSDPKYGWYEPKDKSTGAYYGNEDCLKQWWEKERKNYF